MSVGELVRAHLGDAVFERLVDPLLGGINAGDADHLSIRAGAPQLAAAAERDANLVAALQSQPAGAPGPVFFAPVGGMGALVDALVGALTASGVSLCAEAPIHEISAVDADRIIVTVPAYEAAQLVRGDAPAAASFLDDIGYASVTLVTMAFPASAVTRPLDASGFLVPRTEGLLMTATSWTSSKWAHLGQSDRVIVRVSAGKYGDERAVQLDDDALVRILAAEVGVTSGLTGEPAEVRVSRWLRAFPQYEPGHLDRIEHIENLLAESLPSVVLAGAALRGLGVPACINQGREAARTALGT
jgi:oxygen-dependent protoporphyrinogen oxidase